MIEQGNTVLRNENDISDLPMSVQELAELLEFTFTEKNWGEFFEALPKLELAPKYLKLDKRSQARARRGMGKINFLSHY